MIRDCGKTVHIPICPKYRSEANRRVITTAVAGLDESRPGGARSAPEGGNPSHTTNVLIYFV